ncbi:MAG: hypothetical protein ACOX47_14955 [Bacillota bacterium]
MNKVLCSTMRNITIGIVEAIAGIKTLIVEFVGVANHAGATPMHLRNDPMQAAAMTICRS